MKSEISQPQAEEEEVNKLEGRDVRLEDLMTGNKLPYEVHCGEVIHGPISMGDTVIAPAHPKYVGPFSSAPEGEPVTEIEWDIQFPSGVLNLKAETDQIDGPIKWRDTVNELDAYIEEFTRERESLINRLALEGFALIPAMTAVMGVADSIIPIEEWQIGDIVEVVARKGAYSHEFEIGEHVRIDGFDLDDDNLPVKCYALDESDFWYLKYEEAKFIRRP